MKQRKFEEWFQQLFGSRNVKEQLLTRYDNDIKKREERSSYLFNFSQTFFVFLF